MNLSSCVADSVVLSLDSDGQTLGSGTNPFPLSSFQISTQAPSQVKPCEVQGAWGGQWAIQNRGKNFPGNLHSSK